MVGIVIRCDTVAKLTTIVISTDISTMAQSTFPIMFKTHLLTLVVSLAALMPSLSFAQTTGSIEARAEIVQPLIISQVTPLNFGSFAAGSGGMVTMLAKAGSPRSSTANSGSIPLTLMPSAPGASGTVTVSGIAQAFTVEMPLAVSLVQGNAEMKLSAITSSLANFQGVIPASGSLLFYVGGTLEVNSGQPLGIYSARIPITITYN
jgi:hypothetical protein